MNTIDALVDNYMSLYWISPALCVVGVLITNLLLQLLVKRNLPIWIRVTSAIGLLGGMYASLTISQKLPEQADLHLFNDLICINSWILDTHLILFIVTLFMLLIPVDNKQIAVRIPYTQIQPPRIPIRNGRLDNLTETSHNQNQLEETLNLKELAKIDSSISFKRTTNGNSMEDMSLHVLMLITTLLGGYLLAMANHWLIVYLSIGCMTIGTSVLVYLNNPIETNLLTSTRYLLYGIVASAVMLLGLSYLYGSTGTLTIHNSILYNNHAEPHVFLYVCWPIGFFLALSGLFMASGSFPFQFWVPNIYQPTSCSVVAYLSTVPKVATIVFIARLHQLLVSFNPSLKDSLESLWAILAMLTLLVGHVAALKASDAKKLLAYGTIAQTGSLLTFLVTDTSSYTHIVYYMVAYSMMNMASWLGLGLFTNLTNSTFIRDYTGLGRQFPVFSSCFSVSMLALIGLPPTIGFTAKFILLSKLWEQIQMGQSSLLISLFLMNVFGTLLALCYYLKIPYTLFTKPKELQMIRLRPRGIQLIQIILSILLIGLFFYASFDLVP